jgi:uncharacterized protein (DUF1778 family)
MKGVLLQIRLGCSLNQMPTTTRTEKIVLHITPAAKRKQFSTAAVAHRSMADFVLESTLTRANETMPERQRIGPRHPYRKTCEALPAPEACQ